MDPRRVVSPESALASDIFDKYCSANTLKAILSQYRHLCSVIRIKPTHFPDFYPRLKAKLSSWRAQGLWSKFEKRASHKCYSRGKACYGTRVLIIGAGPCGLRAAIEAQLLGAKVVLVEKRDRFSRNNVLHLWPFVITDLKALGAKKFYGKFCAGSIDHISIRQLQCILLKVALLLGVEIHEGVGFEGLLEATENEGWRATTSPPDHPVSHYNFDVLIGADGRRNTLDGFKRKALRAKLAIAITANFINKHTEAEARVKEISGVSYIFNQKFFQDLNEATGIDLENIVYYKDETHYFVMTAKKQSLLSKGVLLQDHADTARLLSHENISSEALMYYALEAARFSTENQLPNLEFAVNHYGQPDVAMFDFTAMYAAENACRVVQRKGHKLLMTLVGDSLLEPFWPTGSGCARGFLSSFDACWMLRSWTSGIKSMLEVIAERESIYRLLGQTTPENLNKEHMGYTIDPHSRYPNLNLRVVMPFQVKSLYDTDENIPDVLDGTLDQQMEVEKVSKKRRRDSVMAVDSLLSWLRDQVMCYGLEVSDVRDAFVRGDVLSAIIHRFRPDLIEFPLPSEENVDPLDTAAFRNQVAFDLLHEEYGLIHVMSGFDSVQCLSSDFLSLVAYLSQIYEIFRGEIPQIKYPRVESNDELDEQEQRSSHSHPKYNVRPAVVVKHGSTKPISRRNRLSSSGRDSRDGDSETSRRHKKRRSDERSRGASGREIKTTLGASLSGHSVSDSEKHVPGLARDLEEKLKGSRQIDKKPKDLVRAIGKIEKSDWNVQLIEKKIAENKGHSQVKKDREDKVPKWSREAFDDKREAMKRKMEGGASDKNSDKLQVFEETMKKLGNKLKEGNALEVGQRGCNKVSQMAEQLVHKLERPKEAEGVVPKATAPRSVFEFPTKGGSESCHFCTERVYVVERMTAEGKFFHRNCFRCEYCNTSLRVGNYVFDREGRYGERFYCTPHYQHVRVNGWKKYDQGLANIEDNKYSGEKHLDVAANQQIRSEMDERGTTPERVEFENSVDFASEEELLSEMDEDEWTDRNFGASNADNNTSDEASDLSDDDDITPEGNKQEQNQVYKESAIGSAVDGDGLKKKDGESSDSDTEVASGEGSEEDGSCEEEEDEEEEEDDEEEEEECEGSATEIETDSEFAEDPPHSVPGKIPTIVVDEPEQLVTRLIESVPLSHTQTPPKREGRGSSGANHHSRQPLPPKLEDLNQRVVEPVKMGFPERPLPRVTAVPKEWVPLRQNAEVLGPKMSLELKKKYLHGVSPYNALGTKKTTDPTAQNQFRSVLDMISEQQKLLQPAAKHSATMQAILDGAEKLKNKPSISPLGGSAKSIDILSNSVVGSVYGGGGYGVGLDLGNGSSSSLVGKWSHNENESVVHEGTKEKMNVDSDSHNVNTLTMNRLNLEKSIEASTTKQPVLVQVELGKEEEEKEKGDCEKEIEKQPDLLVPVVANAAVRHEEVCEKNHVTPVMSDSTPSISQSETESQSTVIDTNRIGNCVEVVDESELITPIVECKNIVESLDVCPHADDLEEEDSDTETGTDQDYSDIVDIDEEDEIGHIQIKREPPRVEIEDVYGITRAIDVNVVGGREQLDSETQQSDRDRSSESCQTQILQVDHPKDEEEPSKSCGMSSSDSKDSLNSGVFLETELSDCFRDGDVDGGSLAYDSVPKRKSLKKKQAERKKREQESIDKMNKLKSNLALDLEGFAFMDVDAVSSPEDNIETVTRKQGYCKLANDEDVDGSTPEFDIENKKCPLHLAKFDDDDGDDRPHSGDSDSSSRSSTPTIGSVSAAAPNLLLGNTIVPPSSDVETVKGSEEINVQEEVIETINPLLQGKGRDNYAVLDRVVPFSNARDSLDYRKMKGISSPIKSKDLYSTYAVPSTTTKAPVSLFSDKSGSKKEILKPTVESQYDEEKAEEDEILVRKLKESPVSPNEIASSSNSPVVLQLQNESFDGNKSTTSPNTARRIEEIQKERVKQSDLIRSMVMGRIRRSPEKGRKGSRGSLSPLGASSSSASASGSSEQVMSKSDENELDSRRSSQNSILSHSHEGDTTETDESPHNSSSNVDGVTSGEDSLAEPVPSSAEVSHRSSSSAFSSDNNIAHNQMTGTATSSGGTPRSSKSHHYEPVFTSSPRFRNRPKFSDLPKFDIPLKIYQSATNPPTPVHPPMYTPVTPPALTPNSDSSSSFNNKKGISPSFYRSMPDLTACVGGSPHINGKSMNVYKGFATPNVQQWESYKSTTTTADREKVRQAARERARLKSDEELGLSSTDYINVKDKLRRKVSVPEDDVFDPMAAVVVTTPNSSHSNSHSNSKSEQGLPKSRPISDVFDAVASSIRHNVDFPIKRNPFLVSPNDDSCSSSNSSPKRKDTEQMSPIRQTTSPSAPLVNGEDVVSDDFVQLRLRITPKNQTPERKISPEKSRSVGWDSVPDSFPNYFTPHSPTSSCSAHPAPHSFTTTIRNDQNWLLERTNDTPLGRPRSNTMSEINLAPSAPGTSSSCTNCSQSVEESPLMAVVSMMPLPHSHQSPQTTARSASAAAFNFPNHSNTNNMSNHLHASSQMPNMQSSTNTNCKPKAKALSSDTLLDESPSQSSEPFRGISVPDFTHENHSPERKLKKSKDRDRRRSLIQAVSDFFTNRSSSASNSMDKGNGELDKSQTSTSSSAGISPSKDKFSLFKLTPKLLQSKEKRNSKSREMLASPPANQSSMDSSSKSPPKAGFISYLSQPEMVIQKLSSSPTPFKSSRANLNKLSDSGLDGSPPLGGQHTKQDPLATLPVITTPVTRNSSKNLVSESKRNEARRMREVHKIRMQLESIETEQRILEAKGVSIERKLRREEPDNENREEAEMMEEWFTLVREKTRLARFERELLVRAEELDLEERQERLEEQLDKSLLINDLQKSAEDKSREIRILHELKSLEKQRDVLVNRLTEDLKKYESEDADLEEKIASSSLSPRESNV